MSRPTPPKECAAAFRKKKSFFFEKKTGKSVYILSIKVNVFPLGHCSILLLAPNLDDFIFWQFEAGQHREAQSQAQPRLNRQRDYSGGIQKLKQSKDHLPVRLGCTI